MPLDSFLLFASSDGILCAHHMLYKTQLADAAHAPLLCGPYVIFASLARTWYSVKYYNIRRVGVPFKAGWLIDGQDWRYHNESDGRADPLCWRSASKWFSQAVSLGGLQGQTKLVTCAKTASTSASVTDALHDCRKGKSDSARKCTWQQTSCHDRCC